VAVFEEKERDAQLAVMDVRTSIVISPCSHVLILSQPTVNLSPLGISPTPNSDANPFDRSFGGEDDDDDEDDGIDWEAPRPQESHFEVLQASLPHPGGPTSPKAILAGRGGRLSPGREKRKPRWHFGIRSRSPPMEVMLEIYRTLSVLDMEWKEKKYLGGLGGKRTEHENMMHEKMIQEKVTIERRPDMDGGMLGPIPLDERFAASVYYVEARARVDNIVVLLDLQLYEVDDVNYLVDFKHQGYYRASVEPGAKKFDRAATPPPSSASDAGSSFSGDRELRPHVEEHDNTVSSYLFMDTACRLIVELAGGGETANAETAGTNPL